VPRYRAKAFIKLALLVNIPYSLVALRTKQEWSSEIKSSVSISVFFYYYYYFVPSNIHTNADLNCEILLLNYTFQTLDVLHSFTPSVLYQHLQNKNSVPKEKTVRLLDQTLLQHAKHRNDN
jgi:hypothetical protein